jgi:hypothetical protein
MATIAGYCGPIVAMHIADKQSEVATRMEETVRAKPGSIIRHFRFISSVMLLAASPASASGVNFQLSAEGADLGAARQDYFDNADASGAATTQRSSFAIILRQGRAFTLIVQSLVCSRGQACQASKPDHASWTYDTVFFQPMPTDSAHAVTSALRLNPLKRGQSQICLAINLLGYKQLFVIDATIDSAPH